jgi:hypothetical protein
MDKASAVILATWRMASGARPGILAGDQTELGLRKEVLPVSRSRSM